MSETHPLPEHHDESGLYEIRLRGHLSQRWAGWFDGMTITLEDNGDTLLTGPVADQAALHGLLKKVRDVGMPLVSVRPVGPGPPTPLVTGPADSAGQPGRCVGSRIADWRERLADAEINQNKEI